MNQISQSTSKPFSTDNQQPTTRQFNGSLLEKPWKNDVHPSKVTKVGGCFFCLILQAAKVKEAMDLSHFFSPVSQHAREWALNGRSDQIGGQLWLHADKGTPKPVEGDVVIIGIKTSPEDDAPDWVRHYLYSLKSGPDHIRKIDAGDVLWDKHAPEARGHLHQAFEQLFGTGACVIVLGAGQEITYTQFQAMASEAFAPRLALVDAYPDMALEKQEGPLQSHTFLSHILESEVRPKDISLLAYQFPLVSDLSLHCLQDAHYELCRLSEMRMHFESVEPAIRASHLFSFDVGSIRQGDAPGTHHPLPTGLHAEEACRLAKLAGLSPALQCFGLYEFTPAFDRYGQTANLIAQAIWYFLDGFAERYQEHPLLDGEAFYKYITAVTSKAYQLVFFKSKKTGRWWMELPADGVTESYGPIVPCTYEDYLAAMQNHLPDRWLRNVQQHW